MLLFSYNSIEIKNYHSIWRHRQYQFIEIRNNIMPKDWKGLVFLFHQIFHFFRGMSGAKPFSSAPHAHARIQKSLEAFVLPVPWNVTTLMTYSCCIPSAISAATVVILDLKLGVSVNCRKWNHQLIRKTSTARTSKGYIALATDHTLIQMTTLKMKWFNVASAKIGTMRG